MKKYSPEELLKLGIIDEDGFNTLKSKETTKRESKLSLNLFFNILAGILFGLGIIWVVAANWTSIPDYIILALLLIGSAASLFALIKFKNRKINLEILSIIYAAFCIGTIAYIGQYFNVASNTELFLFLCLLIITFISFYSRSLLLSNAYLILGTIYFIVVDEFFAEVFNIPTLVGNIDFTFWLRLLNPLVFAIIPMAYIKFFAKNDEETKHEVKLFSYIEQRYKRIFFDAFLLIFVFALIPDFDNFAEISLLGILLLTLTYKNDHKLIYGLLKLSSIVALLIVSCTELYTDGGVGLSIIPIALGLIYHVPRTLIDIVKKFKEFKNNKEDKMLNLESYMGVDLLFVWSGLLLFALDTWFEFICEKNFHWSVYLLFIIIYAIYSIVDGIKNSRMREFTFGEILIAFEIFRFIFAFEDDLMFRGISAIIIAALILIVNKKASKTIKLADAEGGKNE